MKIGKILLIIVLFISCKPNNSNPLKDEIAKEQRREDLASLTSKLPIGVEKILTLGELEEENLELINIFKYYDTINGKPSLHFKPIESSKYKSFYKPTKSDSINNEDSFFLKTDEEYPFYRLTKILPKKGEKSVLIFEGLSSIPDYDGNLININRKDLVVVDATSTIIDEMNIYFSYTDGIIARTKLFFIDKDYNLYIRYFNEGEEDNISFSEIFKYMITSEGKIVKSNK